MNNLALVLRSQGKYDEAEQMHRQKLELCQVIGNWDDQLCCGEGDDSCSNISDSTNVEYQVQQSLKAIEYPGGPVQATNGHGALKCPSLLVHGYAVSQPTRIFD
ncbi:hypothetical protein LX36DRAFT_674400 [Colletotrichum falcatum]|nr:hypothetical protein LX36DRAFT_674400 [Colletotrichum falcatum]